jgi:hypothetical protein
LFYVLPYFWLEKKKAFKILPVSGPSCEGFAATRPTLTTRKKLKDLKLNCSCIHQRTEAIGYSLPPKLESEMGRD